MLHHKSHSLALAGSITAGIWYSACALFFFFAKDLALKLHAYIMFLDNLDMLAPKIQMSWVSFLNGLAIVMVKVYLFLFLFSVIYRYFHCHEGSNCSGSSSMSR